jgi:hypothetical protein
MIERGVPASVAYEQVVEADSTITGVRVSYYSDPPRAQDRHPFDPFEREVIRDALVFKEKTHAPFWDSVLAAVLTKGCLQEGLLDAICFHQDLKASLVVVPRKDVLGGRLVEMAEKRPAEKNVALLSCVDTRQGSRHLPMIDFACDVSPQNEKVVRKIVRRLISGPVVFVCSGMSYHALGMRYLTEPEHIATLALAIQFGPIVDRTFISHQLRQGFSALRLSDGPNRPVPTVIDILQ